MSFSTGLFGLLTTDPGVVALVGSRVYPLAAPQGAAFPRITHQLITTTRDWDLLGPSGLRRALMQIDVWALSEGAAEELAERLRVLLDGFGGELGGVRVQLIQLVDEGALAEFRQDGSERPIYRVRFSARITAEESRPNRLAG